MKGWGFSLALAACVHEPPRATLADAQRANVALVTLEQGRIMMIQKCTGCHRTPLPQDESAAEWPHAVDEMAERSKLDETQRTLITQYLVVMARR